MAPAAFNAKQESMIIDFYHKTKCLWDFNAVDYKNKYKKEMALNHLCQLLGVDTHGEPCTVSMIKSKFKNLRTTFQREYKKMEENKRSNDGSIETYTPKWTHFQKLLFLKDIFQWPQMIPKGGGEHDQSTSSMSMHQDDNEQGIIYTNMLAQTMKEEAQDNDDDDDDDVERGGGGGVESGRGGGGGGGASTYKVHEPVDMNEDDDEEEDEEEEEDDDVHGAESILPEQHLHEGEEEPEVEQPTSSTVHYKKQTRPKVDRNDMVALYWSPHSHSAPIHANHHHHHHTNHRQTGSVSKQKQIMGTTTTKMTAAAAALEETADQLFGRHVAASLSQIQNKYYKELFKLKVQELILEYTFKE